MLLAGRIGLRKKRGLSDTHEERVLWACAHAVEALHAALIDDHAVIAHFFVNAHIRRADRRAVTATAACISDANAHRRKFVERCEEAAVRTTVRAVALRSEEIDGRKSADE